MGGSPWMSCYMLEKKTVSGEIAQLMEKEKERVLVTIHLG